MSATLDRTRATLLDRRGRVEQEPPFDRPGVLHAYAGKDYEDRLVPDHIKRNLDKAAEIAGPFEPRASLQTWGETLNSPVSDGATTTSAAEVLVTPLFPLPANYLYPGRTMRWTWMGRQSTAITTPGTITFKTAYSATGLGAVVVSTTGAFAGDPTAASTNVVYMGEAWMVCRTNGTAGTVIGWMRIEFADKDDASIAVFHANDAMRLGGSAGVATPAAVAVDTTTAKGWMPTHTESAATHSHTCHCAILEALT